MNEFSLKTLLIALGALLVVSGFFSIAETAMMAVNRYRLRHRAKQGAHGAKLALSLLAQTDKLLGVIRLGDPSPTNFSPLYKGQLLVHGMGFSPDHRTIAVVSIGSNSVAFIDTATNKVKHITYVGRAPHEPFFTPDGKEVWAPYEIKYLHY